MQVLAISGSLRQRSTNTGLLRYAMTHAPAGMHITLADLSAVPLYNSDIDEPPASVRTLPDQFDLADALLFPCTEFNYSLAPALKNVTDWASRADRNQLLAGKPVALLGAGSGIMGTSQAQHHLRQVCVYVDLRPLNKPEVFANAFAGGIDADGNLVDPHL